MIATFGIYSLFMSGLIHSVEFINDKPGCSLQIKFQPFPKRFRWDFFCIIDLSLDQKSPQVIDLWNRFLNPHRPMVFAAGYEMKSFQGTAFN
jgi:hypothetical protein